MAAVRLAGGSLVIVVAASVLGLFPSMTASAGAAVSPQQAGLATLMKSYGSTYKDLIGGSFWQASAEDAIVAAFASQRRSPGKHHPACQGALAAPGTRHRPPACRPTSPSPRPAPGS